MSYDLHLNTSASYELSIQPGGVPLVIHASQYDNDSRLLVFRLSSAGGPLNLPAGTKVEIRGTKPDGKGFSYEAPLDGTNVSVNVTEQMTAVSGNVVCELVLYRENGGTKTQLATANFILEVERAALDRDTIPSESEIRQIYEIADKSDDLIDAARRIERVLLFSTGEGGGGGGAGYAVTPETFGAAGDGIEDDAPALQMALESGFPVLLTQDLYLKSKIEIIDQDMYLDGQGFTLHCDGSAFNIEEGGSALKRDWFIRAYSESYTIPVENDGSCPALGETVFNDPALFAASDNPNKVFYDILQLTEENPWQTIASGETYHRGYISWHGINPTETKEVYEKYSKVRAWNEHRATVQNLKISCDHCAGLLILGFTRMTHIRINNVSIIVNDAEDDAACGLHLDQAVDAKVCGYYAENFSSCRTASKWAAGYGILANGTDVTLDNCTFHNCKHGIDPGGSLDAWCCGFTISNMHCYVNDKGRRRNDGSAQYQQQIDVHPAMQDIMVTNVHITWDDNRTDEEKAENGKFPTIVEVSGRKAHIKNVFVNFRGSLPWDRGFFTSSRQCGEIRYEGVKAPTCNLLATGWRYNTTSDENSYFSTNFARELYVDGCEFANISCGDSPVRVNLSNTTVHYFVEKMHYLRAVNCKFQNDFFSDNYSSPVVRVDGDAWFTHCEFFSNTPYHSERGPALIDAPEGKAHIVDCVFYLRQNDMAVSTPQEHMALNWAEDLYACELAHLVSYSYTLDGSEKIVKEWKGTTSYVAGDYVWMDGELKICTAGGTGNNALFEPCGYENLTRNVIGDGSILDACNLYKGGTLDGLQFV